MMAVLSARMTSQPQRWAAVPAVAMSATGLAPAGLLPRRRHPRRGRLGLAPGRCWRSWSGCSSRCAVRLTGRGRWLVTPVLVVLAAASIGATTENVVAASATTTPTPPPGQTYEVGGHRLHLDCRGQGGPTVVLFNGLGEISASWARITDQVSTTTRVCAYDRAGQGWSEDAASPQDGVTAAEDLHQLLAAAGEEGPYVLVGHSIGGPYALTYAAQYPEQVAGMVLLDSSSPEQLTSIPSYAGQYADDAARPGPAPHLRAAGPEPGVRRLRTSPATRATGSEP